MAQVSEAGLRRSLIEEFWQQISNCTEGIQRERRWRVCHTHLDRQWMRGTRGVGAGGATGSGGGGGPTATTSEARGSYQPRPMAVGEGLGVGEQ